MDEGWPQRQNRRYNLWIGYWKVFAFLSQKFNIKIIFQFFVNLNLHYNQFPLSSPTVIFKSLLGIPTPFTFKVDIKLYNKSL